MLKYKTQADKDSLYNTPPCYGIYICGKVFKWLKKQGVEAVRIEKLPESKHIFTHKEWHMTGYQVLVDELEPMGQDESLLFVETQEIEGNYPIPSAFAAYSAYLKIQTGIQKMKGTTL